MSDDDLLDVLNAIEDEDQLRAMLEESEDMEYRRHIRSRLRELKKNKPDVPEPKKPTAGIHDISYLKLQTKQSGSLSKSPAKGSGTVPARSQQDDTDGCKQKIQFRKVEREPRPEEKSCVIEKVTLKEVSEETRRASKTKETLSDDKNGEIGKVRLNKVSDVPMRTRAPDGDENCNELLRVKLNKVDSELLRSSKTTDTANKSKTPTVVTPRMARDVFKGIDSEQRTSRRSNYLNADATDGDSQSQRPRSLSPNSIKQMMMDWCRFRVANYENVSIDDFSSSWSDGLAFCALVHSFYPDAFDYDELDPANKRHNFQLAFDTAEKRGDIHPLLDVDDMVATSHPDWKCVFTYINAIYSGTK